MSEQHPLLGPGMFSLAECPSRGDRITAFKYLKVCHGEKWPMWSRRAALATMQWKVEGDKPKSLAVPKGNMEQPRMLRNGPGCI